MSDKQSLRRQLRNDRRQHVSDLADTIRALLFKQPPALLMALIPDGSTIGLYHASAEEAPTASYANFLFEAGHTITLPRFTGKPGMMEFRLFADPFGQSGLEQGPLGIMQPPTDADVMTPDVVFVPLIGVTPQGHRLGQGGGYYDRWLAAHPGTTTIGMAWDAQLIDDLPIEAHDMPLTAVVTPTRFFGPFNA